MSINEEQQDDVWMNALAGRFNGHEKTETFEQALVLRKALQARAAILETQVPLADEAQYHALLNRLAKEHLLGPDAIKDKTPKCTTTFNWLNWRKFLPAWPNSVQWGFAAVLVMGITVILQLAGPMQGENGPDTLRGDHITKLILTNPEQQALEMAAALKAIGVDAKITREANGVVVLTVESSDPVLDYLSTLRIEPILTDGQIIIQMIRPAE